jgi:hypothetical protein
VPGVVEHQSWVEFPDSGLSIGTEIAACVDNRVAGRDTIAAEDLLGDVDRVQIPTRWVDMAWLTGQLAADQNPQHWQIVIGPFSSTGTAS